MKVASIITVGSEIVEGIIVNTNAKFLSERLTEIGVKVKKIIAVDDNLDDIVEAINQVLNASDVVVLSG
ncbi:MAG: molybdopterin-binding protein, partial [Pseudothermotoga sp.]